jgi:hypothetical protein
MERTLERLRREFVSSLASELHEPDQIDALFRLISLALRERGPELDQLLRELGAKKDWSAIELEAALEQYRKEKIPPALDAAFRGFIRATVLECAPLGAKTDAAFQPRIAAAIPQLRLLYGTEKETAR